MVDKSYDVDQRMEAIKQMILSQQKAIEDLKLMLVRVVENTQKIVDDKTNNSSSGLPPKGNKETPPRTNEENREEKPRSVHDEDDNFSFHDPHEERMEKLQKQLDALLYKKELNESGVSKSYPSEWDLTPYPEKYKPLKLESYDRKGSPSQHIYYFLSQTGHLMGNDPMMTMVFASTLRRHAFT